MGTRMTVIDGRSFDGGISDPGPPPAPAAPEQREISDPFIPLLSNLFTEYFEKGSAESRECGELLMQRTYLNEACAKFIEKVRGPMHQKLIDEHEAVKAEARAKQDEIAKVHGEIAQLGNDLNRAKDAVAKAMTAFNQATQDRNSLSRFASRKAIADADAEIAKAEKAVDRVSEAPAILQQQINQLHLVELQRLVTELDKIAARETELDARISGRGFTDSFGIMHRPRPPL